MCQKLRTGVDVVKFKDRLTVCLIQVVRPEFTLVFHPLDVPYHVLAKKLNDWEDGLADESL